MQLSLPAVEFAAFMAFALWLVFWQRSTGKRPSSRDDQPPASGDDSKQP